ncbi:DUF4124 domain-containing protein [Pseudoalteromonas fenneropenaei]|uniref:DUF4124 domain-containing protein n=1 Tax=Pseudoalteromonas fenneropenaei TaxID=1737459 RepID=A0ABV7CF03_9GAMM
MKWILMLLLLSSTSLVNAQTKQYSYYKCTTERGVVYSQFPCAGNAMMQTLEHTEPQTVVPTEQHNKTLNQLEKQQIIRNLEREIRAKEQQIAVLKRKYDTAVHDAEDSLTRLMDDKEKRRKEREVKRKVQALSKTHNAKLKALEKDISELEKKLKKFTK